jgi:hypothetical protein
MPLTTPRFRVVLADGSEHEVQIWNADLVRFDMTRNRHKWPDAGAAPMLWQAFIVWSALRREGIIPTDTPWEAFRDGTPQIAAINADGTDLTDDTAEDEEVDPSLAGVEPG